MKYDFTAACENSALLKNETFMVAMSRIAMAVANLVADSPERGTLFDAYAKEHKFSETADVYAGGMLNFGEECTSTDSLRDPTAVSQMIRLLLKDTSLSCAIKSGAVSVEELEAIGIEKGIITDKEVKALSSMGAKSLASVAALNM